MTAADRRLSAEGKLQNIRSPGHQLHRVMWLVELGSRPSAIIKLIPMHAVDPADVGKLGKQLGNLGRVGQIIEGAPHPPP